MSGNTLIGRSVGSGYVNISHEPKISIRETLGVFHVCIRRTKNWREIVAEVANLRLASLIKDELEKI